MPRGLTGSFFRDSYTSGPLLPFVPSLPTGWLGGSCSRALSRNRFYPKFLKSFVLPIPAISFRDSWTSFPLLPFIPLEWIWGSTVMVLSLSRTRLFLSLVLSFLASFARGSCTSTPLAPFSP